MHSRIKQGIKELNIIKESSIPNYLPAKNSYQNEKWIEIFEDLTDNENHTAARVLLAYIVDSEDLEEYKAVATLQLFENYLTLYLSDTRDALDVDLFKLATKKFGAPFLKGFN